MAQETLLKRRAKTRRIKLSRKIADCPRCGTTCKRHSTGCRRLREIGITEPVVLEVTYSKHYCPTCRKHFSLPMDHLAVPSGRFTNRVRRTALDLVLKESMTLDRASRHMQQRYNVDLPVTTLHDWVVASA